MDIFIDRVYVHPNCKKADFPREKFPDYRERNKSSHNIRTRWHNDERDKDGSFEAPR